MSVIARPVVSGRSFRASGDQPPRRDVGGLHPGALVFDPLEPRVLLNAGVLAVHLASTPNDMQDHSVLIRMIDETVQVGAQTQIVQQVEIVDALHGGAVLAVGDLSTISKVAISGGAGNDSVEYDADSFGTHSIPSLQFTGGSGSNALVIDDRSASPATWQVNSDGSGTVSGPVQASFSGVASLDASGGFNTLVGPSADTIFRLTGTGSGSLAPTAGGPAMSFSGFAQLDGASPSGDVFDVLPHGSLAGGISETSGTGALVYTGGVYTSVQSLHTGSHAGSITANAVTLDYSGINAVTLPDPATMTVSVSGPDAVLQDSTVTGMLQLSSAESGTTTFAAPTQSLTVDLGQSSDGGGDVLTVKALDNRFGAGLTVTAESSGDTVDVDGGFATQGGAVSLSADTIDMDGAGPIDTSLSGGAAGGITFAGKNISLTQGATLDAAAVGPGGTAGAIDVGVSDTTIRPDGLPIGYTEKSVSLSLEGATIEGGAVNLTADDFDSTPVGGIAGIASGFVGDLGTVLKTIPSSPAGAFPGLDASVVLRGADAKIAVDSSTITSTGTVTVASTTDVGAAVTAVANLDSSGKLPVSVAAGYGQATSVVDTELTGDTSIAAAGDVTISAVGTVDVDVVSTALANVTGDPKLDPGSVSTSASSTAIAVSYSDLTDTANVGNQASVSSSDGSVNVLATGMDHNVPKAQTATDTQGKAGVTFALAVEEATVQATVDGHVTAAGQVTQQNSFNGSDATAVDLSTGTFHIPGNGLTTGEPVVYDAGPGNTPIGGLTNGTVYYALVQDADDFQLSTVPPIVLDAVGTNPTSTHTLSETTTQTFVLDAVDPSSATLYLPGSGFAAGSTVSYNANGHPTIGGLVSGQSYTIGYGADADHLQFFLPGGATPIQITPNGASGAQTFTDGTNVQTENLAAVDPATGGIDETAHGLTEGQFVTYDTLETNSADQIGNVIDGGEYKVHLLSPDSFQLEDPATGGAITLIDPGAASAQALTYVSKVDSFNPSTAVDPTTSEIYLPGNTLVTGQSVIYNVDPTKTTTQTVTGQTTLSFTLGAIDGSSAHSIYLPNNGFQDGDLVTYDAGGQAPIVGLTSGQSYEVRTLDGDTFQLLTPQGQLVAISQGSASGTQTFTDGASVQSVTLALLDSNNAITLPGTGYTEGQTVAFAPSEIGNGLQGVAANQPYVVHLLSPDTFQLEDPTTHAVELLTQPAGVSVNTLTSANASGDLITVPDPAIGGLEDATVYYVVVVDPAHIRLVASADQVAGSMPVTLTSLGTGTQAIAHQLLTSGIGVTATLANTSMLTSSPSVGSGPPGTAKAAFLSAQTKVLTPAAQGLAKLFGTTGAISQGQPALDENGNPLKSPSDTDQFSGAGALGVIVDINNLQALVGAAPADTTPAVLSSPGDIAITATVTDRDQAYVSASVTQPNGTEGSSFAVSVVVKVLTNEADATVGGNAELDAGKTITVSSDVVYPFLVNVAQYYSDLPSDVADGDVTPVSTFLTDGTAGLAKNVFNDWAVTQADSDGATSTSVSGSIAVDVYNDTSHATIAGGAKINQNIASQTAVQSVVVSAATTVQIVELAGIGNLGISVTDVFSAAKKGAAQLADPNTYVDPAGHSGGKALGGSIAATSINDDTVAAIDPGAIVTIAAAGSLAVTATEVIDRTEIAEAGGSSGGKLAFAGSGLGYRQRSNTVAEVESGPAGGAQINGGGAVDVSATTGGVQVGVAGALVKGGGQGGSGIGISALVNDIQRVTTATIGPAATALGTTPPGAANIYAGGLAVTATVTGDIVGLGAAGVLLTNTPTTPDASPTSALNGAALPPVVAQAGSSPAGSTTSGTGLAGSALVNLVTDDTTAEIDTAGAITVDTLSLLAQNQQVSVLFSGGVAIALNASAGGGKNIGGAFALNLINDDTESHADAATFTVTGADAGVAPLSVTADNEATDVVVSAALSADASVSGTNFAGSVSANRIDDTTIAQIDSATVTQAAAAGVSATNGVELVAVGGGVAGSAGAKGVGASIGFNQITGPTEAEVTGGSSQSSLDVGALTVAAQDTASITSVAVSLGVVAGPGGAGGAFTLAVNLITPDTGAFTHSGADPLEALISNSVVTAPGAVTLTAEDYSNIFSVAGAGGFSSTSSAFGAGISWNQVALDVAATIDRSTVHASAVTLTAESVDMNAPLQGKIAAAAVSGAVGGGAAVAGAVSIDGVLNTIEAGIIDDSDVVAGGAIDLTAMDDATIRTFVGGLAISGSTGVGAALGADYIDDIVTADIDSSTAIGASVDVTASEAADIGALTIGLAGGVDNGIAGSFSIDVITDTVTADVGGTATVSASGMVTVSATNTATITAIAGQLSAGGEVGVGAAASSATVINNDSAFISGDATVAGTAGVSVLAVGGQHLTVFAIGGTVGGDAAVAGSATVTVLNDTTQAYIGATDVAKPAGAGVTAGTGAGTTGDVIVSATSTFVLLGTAGAVAISGGVGVGVGADVGVATRRTTAYIGAGATVKADGSVVVEADANEQVISNSVAGAGGADVGVSATAGVSTLILPTTASIDTGAVVFARSNVVVSAQDDTTVTQVSGNVAGAGGAAIGVAAGVATLDKDTDATIGAGAQVTGLALGAPVTTNTATFQPVDVSDARQSGDHVQFTDADVDPATGIITAVGHGLLTGQEVVYSAARYALGGLDDGITYYVIRIDADHFELAGTLADAEAGRAILINQGPGAPGDVQTVDLLTDVGVPSVTASAFDGAGLSTVTLGPEQTASRKGVVVVAASTNVLQSAGAAAAAAGGVAVPVGGAIAVHTINTVAQIDAGAEIDPNETGAGAAQSVYVDAGRLYRDLTIGLGAGFSATAAVAPAVAVPVLEGETEALVQGGSAATPTTIAATGDVEVAAFANDRFLAVAAGLAGSGAAAVAGSVSVVEQDTTTLADISGAARVTAGGDVLVSATDDTTVDAIAGAAGVALGGVGGAGAFAVTQLQKTTDALIEQGAIVDASAAGPDLLAGIPTGAAYGDDAFPIGSIRGVAVQAASSETVTNGAGSGAGGLYAGLAGAVTVELLDADTLAAIRSGAQVDHNTYATAGAGQSVSVAATDIVNELATAGAIGGGGFAGVGAGVDVAIIRNDTQAVIDGAEVDAAGPVSVVALNQRSLSSTPVAVGAGTLGLGGGISVLSIGGDFSSNYNAQNASGDQTSSNSLQGGNSNVLSQVDGSIGTLLGMLVATPSGGALPPIDPATAVDAATNTIDFDSATNLQTGDAVVYSSGGGAPIQGLVSGQTYFVISTDADRIQLAATQDDAEAGTAIAISDAGATGTDHTFTPATGSGLQAAQQMQDAPTLPRTPVGAAVASTATASGATAAVENAAAITAAQVSVIARQTYDVEVHAGGAGFGGVEIGVGVAVVTMDADASAYVGPGSTITAVAGGASGDVDVEATSDGLLHVLSIAGAASGLLGVGAAVASVTDDSVVAALIGASIDDGVITEAAVGDAAVVSGGFTGLTVHAERSPTIDLSTGAGALSVGAGAASVTNASIGGDVTAAIGDEAQIGAAAGPEAGAVTVKADRTAVIGPFNAGQAEGIGLSAGGAAVAAGQVTETISSDVSAFTGQDSSVYAIGAIDVVATDSSTANVLVDGGAVGALAIGAMIGSATIRGEVEADTGARAALRGSSVEVTATGGATAQVLAYPAGGGVISGVGANASATTDRTVSALIGAESTLTATTGALDVLATSTDVTQADDGTTNVGAVSVGSLFTEINATDDVRAEVGAGSVITAATDFTLEAKSGDGAESTASGGGGGFVGVETDSATGTILVSTTSEIDTGAVITAGGSLTAFAQSTITGTIDPMLTAGGLGAGSNVTTSFTVVNTTTTTVDPMATLTATDIEVEAYALKVSIENSGTGTADGAFAGAVSDATTNVTSDALVTISQGASLLGSASVDVSAVQGTLSAVSAPQAQANAIGGGSAAAPVTLNATTEVTGAAGAYVRTGRFAANADAPYVPTISSEKIGSAFGIDGQEPDTRTLVYDREIDWNSTVVIDPAPDAATLLIDASGAIVTQDLITAVRNGSTIDVNDIDGDPSHPGSIVFYVSESSYDDDSDGVSVTAERIISGTPTLDVTTGIGMVSITNLSTLDLSLGRIDLAPQPSIGPDAAIFVSPTPHPMFVPVVLGSANGTLINVVSDSAPTVDVLIGGDIENPNGTIVVEAGHDIVEASPAGDSITSSVLTLDAGHVVGTYAAPIALGSAVLNASAPNGDLHVSASGTLGIGDIVVGQPAVLDAAVITGSAGASGVLSPDTGLVAYTGGIGTTALPVVIATNGAPGTIEAIAAGAIALAGGPAGLAPSEVQAATGDVLLIVPDLNTTGQDIVLGAESIVRAVAGSVMLEAGDNVTTAAGSTIEATGSVTVAADFDTQDQVGGVIDLRGSILAPSVFVDGSGDPGVISIERTALSTDTTIDTGMGSGVPTQVLLGSAATPAGASGGTLRTLAGAVTIDGHAANVSVLLDDGGDALSQLGTLAGGTLTGFGLGPDGVSISNVGTLALTLGSGADTLSVQSVPATTVVAVQLGAGKDAIDVGTTTHTLSGIAGLLSLTGGDAALDTLTIDDSAETRATSAQLSAVQLSGLGMGSASPQVINAAAGIAFRNFGSVSVALGSGADGLAISGAGSPVTIDTGAGADGVTLGPDLSMFTAPVTILSTAGDGASLAVAASNSSQIVLDAIGGTRGTLTDALGSSGLDVSFQGQSSVSISQGDTDDSLLVDGTVTPLTIVTTGAGSTVTIAAATLPVGITLGGDLETAQVLGSSATLSVAASGSDDLLDVDLSATTAAVSASVLDGAATGAGQLTGALGGAVDFSGLARLDFELGSGNDTVTLNEAIVGTAIAINGGGGDDSFIVQRVDAASGGPIVSLSGGAGDNVATAVITGLPTADQFANVDFSVQTLIVDNSSNNLAGVAWVQTDGGVVTAQIGAGAPFEVIDTTGAQTARIIGGTLTDSLDVVTDTSDAVSGTIAGDTITLSYGGQAVQTTQFQTYQTGATGTVFDGLATGETSFTSGGLTLTTTGTFTRVDAGRSAAAATSGVGVFTAVAADGNPFALYSITLAVPAGAAAPTSLTLSFTTAGGQTGTYVVDGLPAAGGGFVTIPLPATLTDLTSVSFSPGVLLLGGLVGADAASTVAPAAAPLALPTFTLQGNLTFDTDYVYLAAGAIAVNYNGGLAQPNTTIEPLEFISGPGYSVTSTATQVTLNLDGDLVIPQNETITVSGFRAFLINVAGDVTAGSGLVVNAGANGLTPGPGGGAGGGGGGGGAGGTERQLAPGGIGGQGGSGGAGQAGQQGHPGGSIGGGAGQSGAVGDAGASGVNASSSDGGAAGPVVDDGGAGGPAATGVDLTAGGTPGPAGNEGPAAGFYSGSNGRAGLVGGTPTRTGATGSAGAPGAAGGAGSNVAAGEALSGGGGGGGGSGGGGGGAGASGTSGAGGGGGSAGDRGFDGVYSIDGGDGGQGGTGGDGGSGGQGGTGGDGASGGAGGGAFGILAQGVLSITAGGTLQAEGGTASGGGAGAAGLAAAPDDVNLGQTTGMGGLPGQTYNDSGVFTGTGGTGGTGGSGGAGGAGGTGGSGQMGGGAGGGAGGTVELIGSVLNASGAIANVAGGLGVGGGASGTVGRLVYGGDTQLAFNGAALTSVGGEPAVANSTPGATPSLFTGPSAANPFIKGAPATPIIADLQGGAAASGLLAGIGVSELGLGTPPANAAAALVLLPIGPGAYDGAYTGYEMLLVVNLGTTPLAAPTLGINGAAASALTYSDIAGTHTLSALNAGAVWATLVPISATQPSVTVTAGVGGAFAWVAGATLRTGATSVAYITAVRPTLAAPQALAGFNAIAGSADGAQLYAADTADGALVAVSTVNLAELQVLKNGSQTSYVDGNGVTVTTTVAGLTGVSAVAISPDGTSVYTAGPGGLDVFSRDPATGSLAFRSDTAITGVNAIAVSADGTQVALAENHGFALATRAAADGSLTFHGLAGDGLAYSAATAAPSGGFDIVTPQDGGFLYGVDASGNNDAAVEGLPGASAIVESPGGAFVYVASQTGDSVYAIARNTDVSSPLFGSLSLTQTVVDGQGGVHGLVAPSSLAVTADGQYLLVGSSSSNSLAVFQIDPTTGMLTYLQTLRQSVGGATGLQGPGGIFIDPAGAQAFVASAGAQAEGQGAGGIVALSIATTPPAPTTYATQFSAIESAGLTTAGGADVIALESAPTAEVTSESINAGDGSNTVILDALAPTTSVVTGSGADSIDVRAVTPDASLTINAGAGADSIQVQSAGPGSKYDISGGSGADRVRAEGQGIDPTATVALHGDDPSGVAASQGDVFLFDPANPNPNEPNFTPVNFSQDSGTLNVVNKGTIAYDTFEGVVVINPPIITASNLTTAEGQPVTLQASVTLPEGGPGGLIGTPSWDLNNDGVFGDVVGSEVAVPWATLVDYGIDERGTYRIGIEATDGNGETTEKFVNLVVTPTPAVVTASPEYGGGATFGQPYTVDYSAVEAGAGQITAWQVNWGDGSAPQVFGSGTSSAAHVFTNPGAVSIVVSAADTVSDGAFAYSAKPIKVGVYLPPIFAITHTYSIAEGQGLELDDSVAGVIPGEPTGYAWSIGGKAVGSGAVLDLDWAQIEAAGVTQVGSYAVDLTLTYAGGETLSSTMINPDTGQPGSATLVVANTPPAVVVTQGATVLAGTPATFTLAVTSVSSTNQAAGFKYKLDTQNDGTYDVSGTLAADGVVTVPGADIPTAGTHVIEGLVIDAEGGTTAFEDDVVAVNPAPVLVVNGGSVSTEGQPYDLTIGVTGVNTVTGYIVDWGDGVTQTLQGASQDVSHVFLRTGALAVDVSAIDATSTLSATIDVTVADVAPELTLTQPQTTPQGGTTTLTGVITDPGLDQAFGLVIGWGDGSQPTSVQLAPGVTAFALPHVYADVAPSGSYVVSGVVTDDDGETGSASTAAVVTNVAPSIVGIDFTDPATGEGGTATLAGIFADPGLLDTHTAVIDWGDMSQATTLQIAAGVTSFSAPHVYLNNPAGEPDGVFAASVSIVDDHGGTTTGTADETVRNLPPVIGSASVAPAAVTQGTAVTVTGTFSDPGVLDTHTAVVTWGDGTTSTAAVDDAHGTFNATHSYADVAPPPNGQPEYTILATVTDDDGASTTVTVDPPPLLHDLVVNHATINEGGSITFSGTIEDISPVGGADTVSVAWGDGNVTQASVVASTGVFIATHTFRDNPTGQPDGSYSVRATVSNSLESASVSAIGVEVDNLAPSISGLKVGAPRIVEGGSAVLTGRIVDPGQLDSETVSVVWGDGDVTQAVVDRASRTFTATHRYASLPAGSTSETYTVTATATDSSEATGSASAQLEVEAPTAGPDDANPRVAADAVAQATLAGTSAAATAAPEASSSAAAPAVVAASIAPSAAAASATAASAPAAPAGGSPVAESTASSAASTAETAAPAASSSAAAPVVVAASNTPSAPAASSAAAPAPAAAAATVETAAPAASSSAAAPVIVAASIAPSAAATPAPAPALPAAAQSVAASTASSAAVIFTAAAPATSAPVVVGASIARSAAAIPATAAPARHAQAAAPISSVAIAPPGHVIALVKSAGAVSAIRVERAAALSTPRSFTFDEEHGGFVPMETFAAGLAGAPALSTFSDDYGEEWTLIRPSLVDGAPGRHHRRLPEA